MADYVEYMAKIGYGLTRAEVTVTVQEAVKQASQEDNFPLESLPFEDG